MAINALLVLPAAFASIRAPALAPGLALAVLLALCLAAWFAGAGVEETGGSARD
jgi:hypothetical protein